MNSRIQAALLAAVAFIAVDAANAQVIVGVESTAPWQGFVNVSELPANGGAYVFGGAWGVADLTAVFSGDILTLGPNTVGDTAAFWYTPSGGPGATGNKIVSANVYVERTGTFAGQNITFSGEVLSNTLVSGYTAIAFIRDFTADYSSSTVTTAPLVNGAFSISLDTINDPTRHVQYGFTTTGSNVWITDVVPMGTVQLAVVPEPRDCGYAICAAVLLGAFTMHRRRGVIVERR